LEELSNGKGKLSEASEEGQGPCRAVVPMMMMMIRLSSSSTSPLINGLSDHDAQLLTSYFLLLLQQLT
jgi:hypothetical protein